MRHVPTGERRFDPPLEADLLRRNQHQQSLVRLAIGLFGLSYAWLHGAHFDDCRILVFAATGIYLAYNFSAYLLTRRRSLPVAHLYAGPLLDSGFVTLGYVVDGVQASGFFLIFFVIILSNALRFGTRMLRYTQLLALAATAVANAALDRIDAGFAPDAALLLLQLASLIAVTSYANLLARHREEASRRQEEAARIPSGLLDQAPVPAFIYRVDEKGAPRIAHVNPALALIYRDQPSDLDNQPVGILALHGDEEVIRNACLDAVRRDADGAPGRDFYIRAPGDNGHVLRLMGQAGRVRWNGKWLGMCFLLDVSEQEGRWSDLGQSQRRAYMSAMVSGIVHDFRNILTGMIGNAEVLQFQLPEGERALREQVELIIQAGERGSEMVSHLLELSRGETQEVRSHLICDPRPPLTSILNLVRLQLPPHIRLDHDIDTDLPPIKGNVIYLEQILLNLINNATRAIDEQGRITVTIRARPDHPLARPERPAVEICVEDDGRGIAPEDLDSIFKPFWSREQRRGGTGIGLAMVQRIVRWYRGETEVDSTPGRGTRISVYLPSTTLDPTDATPLPEGRGGETATRERPGAAGAAAAPERPMRRWRVLLVDDNPDVLQVHKALLQRMGHEVDTAGDGREGLARLERDPDAYDLLATDYRMPEMDGLALAREARRLRSDLPILMITAFGEEESLRQLPELNVALLGKPISFGQLRETIASLQ